MEINTMEDVGIDLTHVRIITTPNAEAARDAVSADDLDAFRERARLTERAIFKLINALVAPSESALGEHLTDVAYAPFAIIESIEISEAWRGRTLRLKPMVIIDDAHDLHPTQLEDVDLWLRDREVKIARWMLTRIDSLNLEDFRKVLRDEETASPGTNPGRDRVRILLQDTDNRNRLAFRSIAEDVARRYLQPLAAFHLRGSTLSLKTLLNAAQPPVLSDTDLNILRSENARLVEENQLTTEKVAAMEAAYPADLTPDVKTAVTHIMLERELKRTPQRSLFGAPSEDSPEEEVFKVQRPVITGAELQMLHRFDRPFYFGFERLADAANENIEQFVTLASVLVDHLETQAIRGRKLALDARQQHKAVREQAFDLIGQWDFPYAPQVRKLVDFIGGRCEELTLRPNAPLSDGANAYGILLTDLANLDSNDELARVLHYALAYQALVLVEPYECKGKTWALFELGGVAIIAKGLTHSRGGFVEGTLNQLKTSVGSAA